MTHKNSKTAEQRQVEPEALLATLADKVAALATSGEWIADPRFVAAFTRYSTGRLAVFEVPEFLSMGVVLLRWGFSALAG
ncbi:MAG TPA: hypothetical protein VLK79_13785 [Gaiellales bacterium]|nr:hypothetical protein [Gaiellales bacterium]